MSMSLASSLSLILLASAAVSASASASAPQVQATAYTESLCPDCINFIGGAWWNVWQTPGVGYGTSVGDGLGIVSFDQVVFGNAKIDPTSGNITCQHGADECTFNVLQDCAIAVLQRPAMWLPFVHCLESHGRDQGQFVEACAAAAGLSSSDTAAIDACRDGAQGQALHLQAGKRTASLVPAHTFVPWVTLSNAPGSGTFCTEDGCDGFLNAVCQAYTGPLPPACQAVLPVAL